jgi:hypothetical protein
MNTLNICKLITSIYIVINNLYKMPNKGAKKSSAPKKVTEAKLKEKEDAKVKIATDKKMNKKGKPGGGGGGKGNKGGPPPAKAAAAAAATK